MPKKPSFQFYPGDWLKDPLLMMCEPATRGIYIDLICGMHELDQSGKITGTVSQLARLARCSEAEMVRALENLTETNAATVTHRNEKVTVENRRMSRDYKLREGNNLRQKKYRGNGEVTGLSQKCNAPSSSSSSSSSSTSISKEDKSSLEEATAKPSRPKGRRWGIDEIVPDEWRAKLTVEFPNVDIEMESRKFANYWASKSGKDATKIDWYKTFENWIIRANQDTGKAIGKPQQKTNTQKLEEYARYYDALEKEANIRGNTEHTSLIEGLGDA